MTLCPRFPSSLQRRQHRQRLQRLGAALAAGALTASCALTSGGGSGRYYQNDGPPDRVPANLMSTPDAVPRVEPFHAYANRPYTAFGRSYTPMTADVPLRQRGLASWYGRQYHGNPTAIGERYDMFAMTAAHPTLPLPSYVRVTNTRTGQSVIVRANDRGPFKSDRIIDLSYAAAMRLGLAERGAGEVEIQRITWREIGGRQATAVVVNPAVLPPPSAAPNVPPNAPPNTPPNAPPNLTPNLPPNGPASAPPSTATGALLPSAIATIPARTAAVADGVAGANASVPARTAPVADGAAGPAPAGPWAVQLGAFDRADNANALRDRLSVQLAQAPNEIAAAERIPRVERSGTVFRVLVGGFAERTTAQQLADRVGHFLGRDTVLYFRH